MKERKAQAFQIEYEGRSTNQALYDDIVSYLGEYRLNVQKHSYQFRISGSAISDLHIRNVYDGQPLANTATRAILEKQRKGLPTHREEAELEAIATIDSWLPFLQDEDTFFWGSPPGPKEEGYGEYGFLFVGRVKKDSTLNRNVEMTAIRLEHPAVAQYNSALSEFTGMDVTFGSEDDVLRHPFVRRGGIEQADIDSVLQRNFSFVPEEKSQTVFRQVINKLNPMISDFMKFMNVGSKEEKIEALYAIENYALELKNRYGQENENIIFVDERAGIPFHLLRKTYGYEPPKVSGSCGVTGEMRSNNILLNGYENLRNALVGEEWFTCPKCNFHADGPVGSQCPGCGLTKETYVEEGGEAC